MTLIRESFSQFLLENVSGTGLSLNIHKVVDRFYTRIHPYTHFQRSCLLAFLNIGCQLARQQINSYIVTSSSNDHHEIQIRHVHGIPHSRRKFNSFSLVLALRPDCRSYAGTQTSCQRSSFQFWSVLTARLSQVLLGLVLLGQVLLGQVRIGQGRLGQDRM